MMGFVWKRIPLVVFDLNDSPGIVRQKKSTRYAPWCFCIPHAFLYFDSTILTSRLLRYHFIKTIFYDMKTYDLHSKLEPKWRNQRFWSHLFAHFEWTLYLPHLSEEFDFVLVVQKLVKCILHTLMVFYESLPCGTEHCLEVHCPGIQSLLIMRFNRVCCGCAIA